MLFVILALVLVLLIGIFNSSETAFLCIDKTKVFSAAEEKKSWATITRRFIQNPAEFFSTILVCENFLIVISANLMTIFFFRYYGENWVFFSTILLSFFSLIFGQLIPKSIALLYPERILIITMRLIMFFKILLMPFVLLFAKISQSLASLFKISADGAIIRRQDIVFAIAEYEKDTSLLAARLFDFSKRNVSEIMVPISMALVCKKGDDLKRICLESERLFRYVPIVDSLKREIIGVINTKNYFLNNIFEVRTPFFVFEDERCMDVFRKMKERGEHIAIVQDNDRKVVGITTIYDLIEELVGTIREER